jgi:hypothetical protein
MVLEFSERIALPTASVRRFGNYYAADQTIIKHMVFSFNEFPPQTSPGFCRVSKEDSFEWEFGGKEFLGVGEKGGRAGWSQPSAEVVIRLTPPLRVNRKAQPCLRQNHPSRRSAELRIYIHRTDKIILAVKPRGSELIRRS